MLTILHISTLFCIFVMQRNKGSMPNQQLFEARRTKVRFQGHLKPNLDTNERLDSPRREGKKDYNTILRNILVDFSLKNYFCTTNYEYHEKNMPMSHRFAPMPYSTGTNGRNEQDNQPQF